MIVIGIILVVLAALVLLYADRNLHRDERMMKKVWRAGYAEKQVTLPNGIVLNYGEGGRETLPALFLIHGQGQAWQDYDVVLPALSEKYHVFAVDCHGHGKSSHDPARYTCKLMTEDFIWFIRNVIKAPCVVSGHSSGGILATSVAALSPEDVTALVIEDAPFFCVEPEQMKARNATVWFDSFQLMHDFLAQNESKNYNEYYLRHSVIFRLFGGLADKMADSAASFAQKHPGQPLRIWYVPQSMLRGMYYGGAFDMRFAMTFYDGSWFDGTSQEALLAAVRCPNTYIKAKTGCMSGGKMSMDPSAANVEGAILCCANTDADAQRVTELLKNCRRVTTQTNDHLIHCKYPQLFVEELARYSD